VNIPNIEEEEENDTFSNKSSPEEEKIDY